MKWYSTDNNQNQQSTNVNKKSTFLVLPKSVDNNNIKSTKQTLRNSRMGLKLVTTQNSSHSDSHSSVQTWPIVKTPKKRRKAKSLDRPRTATLEKPRILNENLRYTLDMSLLTKEMLKIPNLISQKYIRPVQKTATIVKRNQQRDIEKPKRVNKIIDIRDKNNNQKLRNNRQILKSNNVSALNGSEIRNNIYSFGHESVPEPCQTCGRNDQPERFHSHPTTPRVQSSVFNSKTRIILSLPSPTTTSTLNEIQPPKSSRSNCSTPTHSGTGKQIKSPYLIKMNVITKSPATTSRPNSAPRHYPPRIKTCYLCGREFGSSSLPLHEPKCFERWERENNNLPPNLRRSPPPKPKDGLTPDEWNVTAWRQSQLALVPCENCGRTFQPDRLEVHLRSCLPKKTITNGGWISPNHSSKPITIECYICKRKFGSRSISIHEPQCLKKWHAQNDLLPPNQRSKPPIKLGVKEKSNPPTPQTPRSKTLLLSVSASNFKSTPAFQKIAESLNDKIPSINVKSLSISTSSPVKADNNSVTIKRTIACYLCGREYTPTSLKIHEPKCLKKWRLENDKLPTTKRQKEPEKPDVVFTDNGNIDYSTSNEDNWKAHLSQLIPCSKCSRTFFPDRVLIHENNCKG